MERRKRNIVSSPNWLQGKASAEYPEEPYLS